MSETTPVQSTPDAQLEALHERVNAMLEVPLPKEGDAWPLPVQETIAADTPSAHDAPGATR